MNMSTSIIPIHQSKTDETFAKVIALLVRQGASREQQWAKRAPSGGQGRFADVYNVLLRGGADVHAEDNNGRNALCLACKGEHKDTCACLLSGEGDCFDLDPLVRLAFNRGHMEVCLLLLKRAAIIHNL